MHPPLSCGGPRLPTCRGPARLPPQTDTIVIKELKGEAARVAAARSISDQRKAATVLKGAQLSAGSDILQQLANGLAGNWAKLTDLFRRLDDDGSGTISRDELRQNMAKLGLAVRPVHACAALRGRPKPRRCADW